MNAKIKADLLRAGEMIANGDEHCICNCIGNYWLNTSEASMLDPKSITGVWWGFFTMGLDTEYIIPLHADSEPCRQARLLGIAMMVTMEECGIEMEDAT